MDEQLTPEDRARIERIEAETAERAERENEGQGMALVYMGLLSAPVFFPFLVFPLLTIWFGSFPGQAMWSLMVWALFEFPLLVVAVHVYRKGRFSMPGGRVYEGRIVRVAAVVAVLSSLLASLAWRLALAGLATLSQPPRGGTSFLSELLDIYF